MLANERINIRTTPQAKSIIEQASSITGMSVNSFIIEQAYSKAVDLLEQQKNIKLTVSEWEKAVNALDNEPAPTPKIQELFNKGFTVANN